MNTLAKKLIGSSLLIGVPAIALLAFTSDSLAQYIDTSRNVVADGVIVAATQDDVTIATSGSDPITFGVEDRTMVVGDDREAEPGDGVRVIGRNQDGVLVARVVQLSGQSAGYGYGNNSGMAITRNGEVVAIDANSVTLATANATTTYHINDATQFVRTSPENVEVGDQLQVIGRDSSTGFEATLVVASQ